MNRDDIARMAREAGFFEPELTQVLPSVECFAALVAATERKACLQIADYCADANMPASMAANAIRARGIE